MTGFVEGATTTEAWLTALEYLSTRLTREEFGLIVDIPNPAPEPADWCVVANLNELLHQRGLQDTTAVANTLFPQGLAKTSDSRDSLYRRYRGILRYLRRNPKNRKGTYFERLVDYPGTNGAGPVNQIERIIGDLRVEVSHRQNAHGALRHIYEAPILVPAKDHRPRGFPCLAHLSFHLDHDKLRLTAVYRNQYYVQKALGNFLGLAALQHFVANEAGLKPGTLSVHACHAEVEPEFARRDIEALVHRCHAAIERDREPMRATGP